MASIILEWRTRIHIIDRVELRQGFGDSNKFLNLECRNFKLISRISKENHCGKLEQFANLSPIGATLRYQGWNFRLTNDEGIPLTRPSKSLWEFHSERWNPNLPHPVSTKQLIEKILLHNLQHTHRHKKPKAPNDHTNEECINSYNHAEDLNHYLNLFLWMKITLQAQNYLQHWHPSNPVMGEWRMDSFSDQRNLSTKL